jgi:(R,R)-butanediol dehydrogenase / meso-butanediol dehydrogenase / diacetyl reductase
MATAALSAVPTTMRAARIHGANDLRIEDVPVPAPGTGEVLLRITAAGVCGTDATLFRLGAAVVPEGTEARWPIVLGHEFAGEVVEVGDGVAKLAAGEVVACGAGVSCGACRQCRSGRTNLCQRYATAGVHRDGGLAGYCVVPAAICEPAAAHGVHGDAVALAQPMAVAEHAISVARLAAGERALVLGAGGIGSFATWASASRGAAVTVFDRDVARLAIAATLGAEHTVHAAADAEPIDQLAGRGPFDVVYEMTGAQGPLDAAVALVRPGGRIVAVGVHGVRPPIDLDRITLQEITLHGTLAHVRAVDLPRALDLLGARREPWADVAPVVLTLDALAGGGGPAAAATARPGEAPPIKTLIDPWATEPRPFA